MTLAAIVRPDGYVPLTDRLLPRSPGARVAVIAGFAVLPFVHLLVVASIAPEGWAAAIAAGLPSRFVNAFLVVLSFWGAHHLGARLVEVCGLTHDHGPRATWLTWLMPPVVLDLVLGLANELTRLADLGPARAADDLPTLALSFVLALLIRLPQMAAFWTVVVALLMTARVDAEQLPGRYPDDRSLGMRPVGELVFVVFVMFSAAFVPVFLISEVSAIEFVPTIGLFVLGITAMVLAVWQVHRRMADERARQVSVAKARFAEAYRAAQAASGGGEGTAAERALDAAATRLSTAEALLRGAESIYEWPFDERMQRIVAIVLTGVVTGLIIRAVLLPFGT